MNQMFGLVMLMLTMSIV